ncbi:MAG: zinc ABC transporter substrate-binding protein, partial [Cyanobacteria bacterium P01_H01_bin.121]
MKNMNVKVSNSVNQVPAPTTSTKFLPAALMSALLLGIVSCTPSTTTSDSTTTSEDAEAQTEAVAPDTETLEVVTTFLPITQFTKAVAGDRAEVTQLVPLASGPHDYQARPGEVQLLTQADVLVQNGLEMEMFLEDMIANAENSELVIIDSSEGVDVIATEDIE